jgi:hypothetical protein
VEPKLYSARFVGNPGTGVCLHPQVPSPNSSFVSALGKTTVARLYSDFLSTLGVLKGSSSTAAGPSKIDALFGTPGSQNLLGAGGKPIPIQDLKLDTKVTGLLFAGAHCNACKQFVPQLVQVYNSLKQQNKPFEVVFVPQGYDIIK